MRLNPIKTIEDFKDYKGNDASIEISLYEYGLIWRLKDSKKKEYDIVYGVDTDEKGEYNTFCTDTMSESEFNKILQEESFDLRGFNSYRDSEIVEFPEDLLNAIQYTGAMNIFGSEPIEFSIERIIL